MPGKLLAAALWTGFVAAAVSSPGAGSDPLSLVTGLGAVNSSDRSRIEAGGTVVSTAPARGRDLGVFGITRTEAPPARLITWTREIDRLFKGRYVPAIGRFSTPPRLDDLAGLTLDEDDLNDLRSCRPGDCGVKLSAAEIDAIRRAATGAGDHWRGAVQTAFRRVLLARAEDYLSAGLSRTAPYADRRKPVSPAEEYAEIAAAIGLEPLYGGHVLPYFDSYPAGGAAADVESFLYWSKETLGGGKPIVSLTHAAILRGAQTPSPHAVVALRQVYASHYLTGSLTVTLIVGGAEGPRYLVYVRRARTNAFEGPFGKLVRTVVEHRIRADGPAAFDVLRRKLEAGEPAGPVS